MATGSGDKPLFAFTRAQIPDDAFTRCPKVRFDLVQVREHCVSCEHCLGFTEDASAPPASPERYGSVCAHPVGRWWKVIKIHRDKES